MIDILELSTAILKDAGFTTAPASINNKPAVLFEDRTVLGFLFAYATPGELVESWEKDAARAVAEYQLALRRAAQKAWNTYVIFVASQAGDYSHLAALAAIEEDLTGTRKIARAGVQDQLELRSALLTLLPIQAPPQLEAVDMKSEIRLRTTELQERAVDAFLSTADETVVFQVFEEAV